jgi:hypothetical protein
MDIQFKAYLLSRGLTEAHIVGLSVDQIITFNGQYQQSLSQGKQLSTNYY